MGNFFSDIFGKEEARWETPPAQTFTAKPEYPEATQARQDWGAKLQEWGQQPGYGAISPDWGDIWDTAQKRIKQYYWGGPGGQPGLSDKVRASAAARGVSESPALESQLTSMGYQEASDLGNLATTVGTKEAEFAETGRQNWITSLMKMAGLEMPGTFQSSEYIEEKPSGAANWLGQLVSSMFNPDPKQAGLVNWFKDIMSSSSGGGSGSVGGSGGMGTDFTNWFGADALGSAYA